MTDQISKKEKALEKLKNYSGVNPYLLTLKKNIFVLNKKEMMSDFNTEYILYNCDVTPKTINKVVKIENWYAKKRVDDEKWNSSFVPERIQIISYLGETSSHYHCYIKYKQNMEKPISEFIPKKAIYEDFLAEDYHKLKIDFDRYDKLSALYRPDKTRFILPHQKEAIQFLLSKKKCILADDMGLGKSLELSVASVEGNFDSVLIICPASLKSNWLEELTYYVPQKDVTIIGGFQGFKKEELERYLGYGIGKSGKTVAQLQDEAKSLGKWRDNRFVIINNDILKDVYEMPASRKKVDIQHANENRPMLDYIKNKKSLIIIDEAHAFSNSKSQQYTIVKSLIKNGNPDSIYLSTGTPMKNGPKNYFAMLSLINAPIAENWDYYATRYCNAFKVPINDQERAKKVQISSDFIRNHGKSSWYDLSSSEKSELEDKINRNVKRRLVASGASNLEELSERTSSLYLRRMKSELENALPPKTYHERIFDLTPQQHEEYSKLWDEYEEEKKAELEKLKEEHKDDANFNPELNLNKDLVEGGIYRRYLSNQMVEHTIELADRCLAKNEKVVIATCYDEELNSLRDYYGDKCVVYNGKMSLPQKDEAKAKFMTDPSCMVFIGNIEAAGVGITLIASRVLIFNNISWVPGDNNQMCDRVYRLGQTRDVHIYYQFFRGTQYEKMWDTVGRKTMVINQVIKKETDKES